MTGAISGPEPAALFDLSGTLYRRAIIFNVVAYFKDAGLFAKKSSKKIQNLYNMHSTGDITYNEMTDGCVAYFYEGLAGRRKDDVTDDIEHFLKMLDFRHYLYRTSEKIYEMVADKYPRTLAVTGLPEEIASGLRKAPFPFTAVLGSQGELDGQTYTGRTLRNVAQLSMKGNVLAEYDRIDPIRWERSLAAGNTEQDLTMLRKVSGQYEDDPVKKLAYLSIGLVFNAKPYMRDRAQRNWWFIIDADSPDPAKNLQKVERALKRLEWAHRPPIMARPPPSLRR